MTGTTRSDSLPPRRLALLDRYAVVLYCIMTVLLTVVVFLLPLPPMLGPLLVVFIPTLMAIMFVALTEGFRQVGPTLFGREAWRISLKWALVSLGMGLVLRVGVSLLALVLGYPFQPQGFTPLLAITILFAAGEEIGWRGYALPRMLKRFTPLAATLLLGVPWALLHIPLTLPGRMNAGTPVLPLLLVMLALSVLTTWAYLGAGRSILAPALLHGGQNLFVFLNNGVPVEPVNWVMAVVYLLVAVGVVLVTRGRLGKNTERIPEPSVN